MSSFIPLPPPLPIGHQISIGFGTISFILYAIIITVILRNRKKIVALQTSFYTLLIMEAVLDMVTYLVIELLVRPRKFRYFSLFEENPTGLVPYICYYSLYLGEIVVLGKTMLSVNRLMVFHKLGLMHVKKTKISVYLFLLQCSAGILLFSYTYFTSVDNTITLQITESGVLRIVTSNEMNERETTSVLCVNSFASTSTIIFHVLAVYYSRKCQHNYNKFVERKLLFYSICASVPMFFEMIRILCQRNMNPEIHPVEFVEINDYWFYTIELMTMSQPWIIILSNETVRNLLYKEMRCGQHNDQSDSIWIVSRERLHISRRVTGIN